MSRVIRKLGVYFALIVAASLVSTGAALVALWVFHMPDFNSRASGFAVLVALAIPIAVFMEKRR
jgi:hypothetical protein